jgi:hypothetical protein
MAKGIVRITPKGNSLGKLTITVLDANPYGVLVGTDLFFPDPKLTPPIAVNDIVTCTINSATTCTVTKKG